MNGVTECPVCGLHQQQVEAADGGNRKNVHCERCGDFEITIGAARKVMKSGLAGHLSAWIRDHKEFGRTPPEITQDNVDGILNNIPKYGVSDKQRILLRALERKTTLHGDHIGLDLERDFPVAWASTICITSISTRGNIITSFGEPQTILSSNFTIGYRRSSADPAIEVS